MIARLAVLVCYYCASMAVGFQQWRPLTTRATLNSRDSTSRSLAEGDENSASSASSSSSSTSALPSMEGKTVYQRTFFRLQQQSSSPALPLYNALVIEERLRYRPSAQDATFMEPFGPRTLILRDGQVEEGAIGDAFATLHVHEVPPRSQSMSDRTNPTSTLQHGGRTGSIDESLVLALVLAAQPERLTGPVLEIAARQGLGTLVGCLGAAWARQTPDERAARLGNDTNNNGQDEEDHVEEDVLTVPTDHPSKKDSSMFPKDLTLLTLTDDDAVMLDLCAAQISTLPNAVKKKVNVQALDWRTRALPMAALGSGGGGARKGRREYATVALADLPLTFPETKEMARTVAYSVGPSNPSIAQFLFEGENNDNAPPMPTITPRFIHVSHESREESIYLRKFLTEGCRMEINTDYVTVEKIGFAIQSIDSVPPAEEDALLDAEELEVANFEELVYQLLTAQHHVDYRGGGSGELFFPMETTDISVGRRGGGGGDGPEPAREPGSFLG